MKPTLLRTPPFVKREAADGMSVSVGLPSPVIPPIIQTVILFVLFIWFIWLNELTT